MRIGVLTFYKTNNFGANLQGISTYYALQKLGHTPIFIDYQSVYTETEWETIKKTPQGNIHNEFVNNYIQKQTEVCHNIAELQDTIDKYDIEAIIIGSDAVVQHHPLADRIRRGRRRPFYIQHYRPESMFPNLFWGEGFVETLPCAMLSVSSQNSEYKHFTGRLRKEMYSLLRHFRYISVRDNWTKDMFHAIDGRLNVNITPDPVFAFNYNAGHLIPSKEDIASKYTLPPKYLLVSLHSQCLSIGELDKLKNRAEENGITCIALPMPEGYKFSHHFDVEIPMPLSSIDWYALIKYSNGYVGSNMHPIVVALHNAVPCFSIDHWGTTNFWGKKKKDGSSKVEDILRTYGLEDNRCEIVNDKCAVAATFIINKILSFPKDKVAEISVDKYTQYCEMMNTLLKSLEKRR